MPALEGEEEEDEPKEKLEVKTEENEGPKEIPVARSEEKAESKDFMERKPEVKDPKEVPQFAFAVIRGKGQLSPSSALSPTLEVVISSCSAVAPTSFSL
ncbi:Nucleosome assembly protein 1-like 3 [Manis javanica]|nr:Nucleosome assembly protein 1-like 3 [Manis javanica]